MPVWTGGGFQLGTTRVPVLEYSENFAGWSDDLTSLHEDSAGESHPIDRASRYDAVRQLSRHLTVSKPVILEIGCSSGYMIRDLRASFPAALVIGADVVKEPLHRLAEAMPGVPLLRFDLLKCPLPDACVDAVVMLNVLEHIEDDDLALSQVRRVLKPSGLLVLEVPAGPALYDSYDQALRHFRRYESSALCAKVERAGFEVLRRTHLGFFLYPLFALVKRRNQRRAAPIDATLMVARQASRTAQNPLLAMLLALETKLASNIPFPVGIRCLLTCRARPAGGPS